MTANIINGKDVANTIKKQIAVDIASREAKGLPRPGLAVILVDEDPASKVYVGHKQRACEAVGILSYVHKLPGSTTQKDLEQLIEQCNQQVDIHGILLQLPLPSHLSADDLLETIDPDKDVDGFHPYNLGRLAQRRPRLQPCTPKGVITLLEHYNIPVAGKHAVVVGASNIVGRPMSLQLLLAKATTTVCHRYTKDLEAQVRSADILVVAIGKPGVVKTDWIKPGAVVIDVGLTRLDNGKLVGDIDFDTAKDVAGWITPVPGGVGPMTVATLLQNTLQAADFQKS